MTNPAMTMLPALRQSIRSATTRVRMPPGRSAASFGFSSPAVRSLSTSHQAGPSKYRYQYLSISHTHYRSATTLASQTPDSQPPIIPSRPDIRIIPPSIEAVKAEGFFDDDVKLVPLDEAGIVITPEAVTQLAQITSREPPDVLAKGKLALRLAVDSGGCHGYQDTLSLTEDRNADDYVYQPQGVNCIPVVIDLMSLNLLKGSTLHYATELIGSSFRIQDNPQAKQGGACGCGVSWEAA